MKLLRLWAEYEDSERGDKFIRPAMITDVKELYPEVFESEVVDISGTL